MSLREELEKTLAELRLDDRYSCRINSGPGDFLRAHGQALVEALVKLESENERIGAFVRRVEREGASNLHQSMAHAFITHALSGEHDEAG